MNNDQIADNFTLLAKLMDIHGDNTFKSRSYANAAYQINQLNIQLDTLTPAAINALKGIGDAIGKKIQEQIQTGILPLLQEYLDKTPAGIIEMLSIKGLGPKKIATIWKELEIETLGELLYACHENRLTLYKGFGEKTQQNIREAIEFYLQHQGQFLFAELEPWANLFLQQWQTAFPDQITLTTGALYRQLETLPYLEYVTTVDSSKAEKQLEAWQFTFNAIDVNILKATSREGIKLYLYHTDPTQIYRQQFERSAAEPFLQEWNQTIGWKEKETYDSEAAIFSKAGIHPIPAYRRETAAIIHRARTAVLPDSIITEDIRGIIHCHSQWSDGSDTLETMAKAARDKGLEYLVISDHSRSAFYANGLQADRVMAQHREIEKLNTALAPFTIFKSIESDVLSDGALDYPPEVLAQFDLIIASIHSNLKMPQEKAMHRLLTAVANPFTSILGHPTGRLLLSRSGYPVDHERLLQACAEHKVVIELNAHPRRLDLDWRWIERAQELGVMISINPDAHNIAGLNDIRYGVLVAQKAGLPAAGNLSSLSLSDMRHFIANQQQKRP
ncbi:MAG: helix-hairpin-helix domain-containing protein [Bacteroidota bacterium]